MKLLDLFSKKKSSDLAASNNSVTPWSYGKRLVRDVLLLGAVVYIVSWGQSFKFTGQLIPKDVFTSQWSTQLGSVSGFATQKELLVLFIFAPWCQVCHLNASVLNQDDKPLYSVQGVAMSYNEPKEVDRFVNETGFKPQVLFSDTKLDQALGINQYPTFLVVSRNGEVLTGWSGYTTGFGFWLRIQAVRFFASHILS